MGIDDELSAPHVWVGGAEVPEPLHQPTCGALAPLELVETLQGRLAIVVPHEVTARVRTVADLQDAVAQLVAAALLSAPTARTRS
ncbi:hypothetical protein ACIA8E_36830 [Streptomyces sp. NPDC051664]|uniref:hypothetical protein n=1 Tax=Streptomyces sp. NPDC051664 TaxID=3365668 RepID=UPI0037AEFC57